MSVTRRKFISMSGLAGVATAVPVFNVSADDAQSDVEKKTPEYTDADEECIRNMKRNLAVLGSGMGTGLVISDISRRLSRLSI